MILEASGKEQVPKKTTAPGLKHGGGGGGGKGADTSGGGKDSKGGKGGKGDKGGKGGKQGKGKGDGHSGNTDSENETPTKPRKTLKDYDGIDIEAVPESERCCLQYLWVMPDGKSRCYCHNQSKECKNGQHTTSPAKSMLKTKLYKSMVDRYGKHNVPKAGPAPPKKSD